MLEVGDLRVTFPGLANAVVDGVDLTVERGECVALVGESGSGKSMTALALMGLTPRGARISARRLTFLGEDLLSLGEGAMQALRGRRIAMVFQDPMTSLNPTMTVGRQIAETIEEHFGGSRRDARRRSVALLDAVGMPDPDRRFDAYPHALSGGMRQRAMIALALSCDPALVIADEPTTALDVTVQAQILELLARLGRDRGAALLLITHDLGIVARMADRVNVMYAGRIVEADDVDPLFERPRHPYTQGLLDCAPRVDGPLRPLMPISGSPPDPRHRASGCRFRPRCPKAMEVCTSDPPLVTTDAARVACWLNADSERPSAA